MYLMLIHIIFSHLKSIDLLIYPWKHMYIAEIDVEDHSLGEAKKKKDDRRPIVTNEISASSSEKLNLSRPCLLWGQYM